MRTSILISASVLCAFAVTFAPGAHAQSNPSADQIIKSLTPTGPISGGTRGIRPLAPTAPAAAPRATPAAMNGGMPAPHPMPRRAPTPVVSAGAAAKAPSVNLTVEFRSGSAVLTPAATHTLDKLGEALTSASLSAYRFRIEGHTDTVGTAQANMSLSEQRAAAVAKYLEDKFKVTPTRLQTVGLGEQDLLVQTPSQTPEMRNRRVQVINLGA